jgi:hypothetical protein
MWTASGRSQRFQGARARSSTTAVSLCAKQHSRETLAALREALGGGVFMDVNLRAPWWDRDTVHALMARATWVKLNEDELSALGTGRTPDARVRNLLERFDLEAVILTRGAEGALVAGADGTWLSRPAPPVERTGGHRWRGRRVQRRGTPRPDAWLELGDDSRSRRTLRGTGMHAARRHQRRTGRFMKWESGIGRLASQVPLHKLISC